MSSKIVDSNRVDAVQECRCDLEKSPQNQFVGPFREVACYAASHGFAVIPCGGADDPTGKRPLIKWSAVKARPGMGVVERWADRPAFRAANLGIITGLSGLTVVDCDTPGRLLELYELFGETPIVVATPSGGLHLYYRSSGERSGPFRVGDIRGDTKGLGGFVVGPPSVRVVAGRRKAYRFLEGNWSLREILPPIRRGAPLGRSMDKVVPLLRPARAVDPGPSRSGRRQPQGRGGSIGERASSGSVGIGARNRSLFKTLLREARFETDEAAVLQKAVAINATFDPPLELSEALKVAGSVWRYRVQGQLIGAGEQAIVTRAEIFKVLSAHRGGADALMLLGLLQVNHGGEPGKRFAVSPKAMAAEKLLAGWTAPRYRAAIATLREVGLLCLVHAGGRRKGDASLYALGMGNIQQDQSAA